MTKIVLYSDVADIYSHQARIVLAEKDMKHVDIISIDINHPPDDLKELNPYASLPTLVDRHLVLYEVKVIMEYLDERFPHPPLLPVYPVARAKCRLIMYRFARDFYSLMHQIQDVQTKKTQGKLELLQESLQSGFVGLADVFSSSKYFLSNDFTLIDCVIAPLLWRLPHLGVELPNTASTESIRAYQDRVFSREGFQASMTEVEREMRGGL